MLRRRFLSLMLIALLLACCLLQPAAAESARELLEIQVSAQPEELVEPGNVALNFSILNRSELDAQGVYLSSADGLVSEPVGRIAAGETQSFSRSHSVTEAELAAGEIVYIISHDDPQTSDGKVNYSVIAPIRRSAALVQAEFTRRLSSRSVAPGGALTISYGVYNAGNVALTNLRVQDALGDFTGLIERLEPGERKRLVSRTTLTEPLSSSATLQYSAEGAGEGSFIQTLEDVQIALAQSVLAQSFELYAREGADDVAELALTLRNEGNVPLRDICVTDALHGGIIFDALTLDVGAPELRLSRSVPVRGDEGFRWHISAASEGGDRLEMDTELLRLPEAAERLPERATLSAQANTPRIRRSGDVRFALHIANTGGETLRALTLSEETQGELRSFAILPAGDTIDCELSLPVSQTSSYRFELRYRGADGEERRALAEPVDVVIASDGALPEGAKPGFFDFSGTSIKLGGSSTFAVLFFIGCGVLIVLIVLLLIATRRARLEKRLRAAEKRRRRANSAAQQGKNTKKGRSN